MHWLSGGFQWCVSVILYTYYTVKVYDPTFCTMLRILYFSGNICEMMSHPKNSTQGWNIYTAPSNPQFRRPRKLKLSFFMDFPSREPGTRFAKISGQLRHWSGEKGGLKNNFKNEPRWSHQLVIMIWILVFYFVPSKVYLADFRKMVLFFVTNSV